MKPEVIRHTLAEEAEGSQTSEAVAETAKDDWSHAAMIAESNRLKETREKLEKWKLGVVAGDHPYLFIPKGNEYRPGLVINERSAFTKTVVTKSPSNEFNGDYYHSREINGAELRAAAEDSNPRAALEAMEARWKRDEISPEPPAPSRSTLQQWGGHTFLILLLAVGLAWWLFHSHETKRREAEAAEAVSAKEIQAQSIVAGVRSSWNAIDGWEDALPSGDAAFATYTIELQNALIRGKPIVAFGIVDDVRKSGEQDDSTVLFQGMGRTKGMDLRFALSSDPATTRALLDHKDQSSDLFVFAATITSVERVSKPADSHDDGQDYFLAQGVLHDARSIGFRDEPPTK